MRLGRLLCPKFAAWAGWLAGWTPEEEQIMQLKFEECLLAEFLVWGTSEDLQLIG